MASALLSKVRVMSCSLSEDKEKGEHDGEEKERKGEEGGEEGGEEIGRASCRERDEFSFL